MKTVSRATDQAVLVGGDVLVSVMAIDAAAVRLGVRCPAGWRVEQVELAALKRRGGGVAEAVEPPGAESAGTGADAATADGDDRRTRFFTLPVHGLLRIGPDVRVQVAEIAARFAVLAIDGVPAERVEEV